MISFLTMLAFNISMAHDYQYGIYDCTEYSRELNRQLRRLNYNSYCVFGKLRTGDGENDFTLHNWVVIRDTQRREDTFIETTQGNNIGVLDKDYYENNYIELRRGKCQ